MKMCPDIWETVSYSIQDKFVLVKNNKLKASFLRCENIE
jgi:hypothetical protein